MVNMEQVKESSLNRILSHMEDKDIATITAFRTDKKLNFSKKINRERNKRLESKLKSMGYNGFTKKIIGYWDETPEDESSKPIAEESYVVLNVGNKSFEDFVTDMIMLCKDVDDEGNDQQAVMIWSHEDKLTYVFNNKGDITNTFNDFKIDSISQAWSQVGNHKLTFVEESVNEFFFQMFLMKMGIG